MPGLAWDKTGERYYEQGVSKGVIYMRDGRNVVWNGLVSITQGSDRALSPIYYDGMKVNDLATPADFRGVVSALTYPDEVLELEGVSRLSSGIYIGEQAPQVFNLSYQTRVGNDVAGTELGYKIHLLYNVTMIASDKNYQSMSDQPGLTPFQWNISTVPQEVTGFAPTSRIMLDSREITPSFLAEIELRLYGGVTADPSPPSFDEMMEMLLKFYAVDILDRKDGTWSATSTIPGFIVSVGSEEFELRNVDAEYIDADTYNVSDTSA